MAGLHGPGPDPAMAGLHASDSTSRRHPTSPYPLPPSSSHSSLGEALDSGDLRHEMPRPVPDTDASGLKHLIPTEARPPPTTPGRIWGSAASPGATDCQFPERCGRLTGLHLCGSLMPQENSQGSHELAGEGGHPPLGVNRGDVTAMRDSPRA